MDLSVIDGMERVDALDEDDEDEDEDDGLVEDAVLTWLSSFTASAVDDDFEVLAELSLSSSKPNRDVKNPASFFSDFSTPPDLAGVAVDDDDEEEKDDKADEAEVALDDFGIGSGDSDSVDNGFTELLVVGLKFAVDEAGAEGGGGKFMVLKSTCSSSS